jgi:Rod binding domain-containing protein
MPGPIHGIAQMPKAVRNPRGNQLQPPQKESKSEKIQKACRDFESLFIHYMMKEMRQTVPQNEMFGGGKAESLYTSMLDSEVAKTISNQRGIGLAPILYQQLIALSKDSENK